MIPAECGDLTSCVVTTTPSAWRTVEPLLPVPPLAKVFVESQEEDHLLGLLELLPRADRVLGIGGGKALDAAKLVAWKRDLPYVMIPTIVSSGAVFLNRTPIRRNNALAAVHQVPFPDAVIFDTDVIRAAPAHFNAAGMGECVCWLNFVASWHWTASEGLAEMPWDDEVAQQTVDWVRDRSAAYAEDLDKDGRPGERGIRIAAEVNLERDGLQVSTLGVARPLCHIFAFTFLWTHGWDLLHGELVALGALIGCHVYDWGFDEAKTHLTACGTRFRPAEIGCTWDDVRATCENIAEHANYRGEREGYFHHRTLSDAEFRKMAARIDAA